MQLNKSEFIQDPVNPRPPLDPVTWSQEPTRRTCLAAAMAATSPEIHTGESADLEDMGGSGIGRIWNWADLENASRSGRYGLERSGRYGQSWKLRTDPTNMFGLIWKIMSIQTYKGWSGKYWKALKIWADLDNSGRSRNWANIRDIYQVEWGILDPLASRFY